MTRLFFLRLALAIQSLVIFCMFLMALMRTESVFRVAAPLACWPTAVDGGSKALHVGNRIAAAAPTRRGARGPSLAAEGGDSAPGPHKPTAFPQDRDPTRLENMESIARAAQRAQAARFRDSCLYLKPKATASQPPVTSHAPLEGGSRTLKETKRDSQSFFCLRRKLRQLWEGFGAPRGLGAPDLRPLWHERRKSLPERRASLLHPCCVTASRTSLFSLEARPGSERAAGL